MAEKVSGIYQIRHKASGLIYVGSARNIRRRWTVHRYKLRRGSHENPRLQRAWTKHGEGGFAFEVLEVVPSVGDLLRVEQEYLDRLQPWRDAIGYNVCLFAAAPRLGRAVPLETRARISAATKGRIHTPEARARMSASRTGKRLTAEHRANIGAAVKGRLEARRKAKEIQCQHSLAILSKSSEI